MFFSRHAHHLHQFGDVTVMSAFNLIATELTLHMSDVTDQKATYAVQQEDINKSRLDALNR